MLVILKFYLLSQKIKVLQLFFILSHCLAIWGKLGRFSNLNLGTVRLWLWFRSNSFRPSIIIIFYCLSCVGGFCWLFFFLFCFDRFFNFFKVLNFGKLSIKCYLSFIAPERIKWQFHKKLLFLSQHRINVCLILLKIGLKLIGSKVQLLILEAESIEVIGGIVYLVDDLSKNRIHLPTIFIHLFMKAFYEMFEEFCVLTNLFSIDPYIRYIFFLCELILLELLQLFFADESLNATSKFISEKFEKF